MKKIPTMFERDWNGDRSLVLDQPHADCGWVFAGEGTATQKIDGTCCMVRDGALYKRRELREGQIIPHDFEIAETDAETKKVVGWVPVGEGADDRWHREAFARGDMNGDTLPDGTYELVGPKVQGNPEGYAEHVLIPHIVDSLGFGDDQPPRDFDGLQAWLSGRAIEGIVFHHPDGRMAKVKKRDFGMKREDR